MSNQNLNNKSVDELREMKAKNEAEIRRLENKIKYLDSQAKQLTRKERTHRLCARGAMLEKYLGEFADEQVETVLKIAFHTEAVGRVIEHFKECNEKE